MKKITYVLLFASTLISCGHNHFKGDAIANSPLPTVSADAEVQIAAPSEQHIIMPGNANEKVKIMDVALQAPPDKNFTADTSKKITKEGELRFETPDVVKTRKNILHSVQNAGGYIAEDTQSKEEGSGDKTYVLKVRIPSKNFDFLIDTVATNADKIDSRNIRVKDITTEYIDTKTQIENKKKLEQTYIGLLGKAGKMADVLQIEDKISEIQGDIESTQGRLNYMTKQVAYSSLDITFYSKSTIADSGTGFTYELKTALGEGWSIVQTTFFFLIDIWPVLILCFAFYWFVVRRKKRLA
ncbi:DUF4349 domain-containing protein [Mucilaginibacter sp. HMF5004]|uniref:DUF4349 domain-containing protein n=1 Tax=Mucilaginibacter rivuli TaxID=2857527 RepID=UPI001C60685F|nr:DUF4349 domain-containing protein [Mucilaginibacter rivuli]MBW4890378.1 DUF4349 domain-containing protein [Mucilaginibacter rivuli]